MLRLMESVNTAWHHIMTEGARHLPSLFEPEMLRDLSKMLKINSKVCAAAGAIYLHQLSLIFRDALNLYRVLGEQVVARVAAHV